MGEQGGEQRHYRQHDEGEARSDRAYARVGQVTAFAERPGETQAERQRSEEQRGDQRRMPQVRQRADRTQTLALNFEGHFASTCVAANRSPS